MKVKEEEEIRPSNDFTGISEWCDGAKNYVRYIGYIAFYKDGKLHRDNYPARIWPTGACEYWIAGRLQ